MCSNVKAAKYHSMDIAVVIGIGGRKDASFLNQSSCGGVASVSLQELSGCGGKDKADRHQAGNIKVVAEFGIQ